MAVNILSVTPGSYAQKYGIKPGETLVSINENEIYDVLDYRFHQANDDVELVIVDKVGERRSVRFCKGEHDEIGLEFETYLIDKQHSCRNKCIFCFIDQLPKGMRESLYFKDDDSRLSFLFGNYITLTNLSEHEIQRIISMHISPINISVHTTDLELRNKIMGNRFAGESLKILEQLTNAGIMMNCQIVLCKGINDGEHLVKTLNDLETMIPQVTSIAVVPVGLTKYREGLYPLEPYDEQSAGEVIDIVESFAQKCFEVHNSRVVFAADEFYLKANRELPEAEYYEDFSQLENGVGGIALLRDEFRYELEQIKPFPVHKRVSLACGIAIKPFLQELVDELIEKFPGVECNIYAIKNNFFGNLIDVSGLVTGQDLIEQLKDKDLGKLLIPSVMLRRENDIFLDDVSVDEVGEKLLVPIDVVPSEGGALVDFILDVKS